MTVSQQQREFRYPVRALVFGYLRAVIGLAASAGILLHVQPVAVVAVALGAAAVQVGTAYMLCPEASTNAVHRAALKSEAARHTALTNVFTGRPARGIVNRLVREIGPMSSVAPPFPLATAAILPLRTAAERRGSGEFSPLWSGQNASRCSEIPAADLTLALSRGCAR